MLRLERARSREIHIAVKQREIICNKPFLIALGIAVGIHLFAFLLFKIHAFLVFDESATWTTVVESDLSSNMDDVLAFVEDEEYPKKFLFHPTPTPFAFPMMPMPNTVKYNEPVTDLLCCEHSFDTIEDHIDPFVVNQGKTVNPIEIHLSGHLAELKMLKSRFEDLETELLIKKWSEESYLLSFDVEVENHTGQIFWYSPRSSVTLPHLYRLAEKILNDMRFQPTHDFVTRGFVEILFRRPQHD